MWATRVALHKGEQSDAFILFQGHHYATLEAYFGFVEEGASRGKTKQAQLTLLINTHMYCCSDGVLLKAHKNLHGAQQS